MSRISHSESSIRVGGLCSFTKLEKRALGEMSKMSFDPAQTSFSPLTLCGHCWRQYSPSDTCQPHSPAMDSSTPHHPGNSFLQHIRNARPEEKGRAGLWALGLTGRSSARSRYTERSAAASSALFCVWIRLFTCSTCPGTIGGQWKGIPHLFPHFVPSSKGLTPPTTHQAPLSCTFLPYLL